MARRILAPRKGTPYESILKRHSEPNLTDALFGLLNVAGERSRLHERRQGCAVGRQPLRRERDRRIFGVEDVEQFRDRFNAHFAPYREQPTHAKVQLRKRRTPAAVHGLAVTVLLEGGRSVVVESREAVSDSGFVVDVPIRVQIEALERMSG